MIRALEGNFLSPLLKRHGFKRKSLTWNRASGDIVHVIDAQVSRFSGPDRVDLTVNVGIWARPLWIIYSAKETPSFVREHDCWPCFRIGQLLADFRRDAKDVWWKLTGEADVEMVGTELCSALSDKCIPFLNGFRSLEDLKRFCDTTADLRLMPGGKLYLAILNYKVGDRAGYERLITEFADEKLRAWQARVAEVVERLEASTGSIP
jgi:hypothetical protein